MDISVLLQETPGNLRLALQKAAQNVSPDTRPIVSTIASSRDGTRFRISDLSTTDDLAVLTAEIMKQTRCLYKEENRATEPPQLVFSCR